MWMLFPCILHLKANLTRWIAWLPGNIQGVSLWPCVARCESSTKLRVVTYNYADPIFIQIIQTGFWRVLYDWTKCFDEPEVGVRPSSSFDPRPGAHAHPKMGHLRMTVTSVGLSYGYAIRRLKEDFNRLVPRNFVAPCVCCIYVIACFR